MASVSASRAEIGNEMEASQINKDENPLASELHPSSSSYQGDTNSQHLSSSLATAKADVGAEGQDSDLISAAPKKSVSFSELPGRSSLKMTSADENGQQAEISEDEHTSMLSSHRSSGQNYSTVAGQGPSSARSSGLDDLGDAAEGGGATILKNRKRTAGKGKQVNGTENTKDDGVWQKLKTKYGSVELENKGSVARDHLALERTFLAWLRTSLSFASIGIAVTQLFRLNTSIGNIDPNHPALNHLRKVGKPLGATFLAIAIVVLFLGFNRYFEGQHYIIRGKFPASRASILILTILAFGLTVISLTVILVIGGSNLSP